MLLRNPETLVALGAAHLKPFPGRAHFGLPGSWTLSPLGQLGRKESNSLSALLPAAEVFLFSEVSASLDNISFSGG